MVLHTRLAPVNGLVKIANGRDAADAVVASIFGNARGTSMSVSCQAVEPLTPLFYKAGDTTGISYIL